MMQAFLAAGLSERSVALSYLILIGNDTKGIELIVNNSCAPWTNNRKISNFAHLLACGDINLGICFEITFHLENMNYLQTNVRKQHGYDIRATLPIFNISVFLVDFKENEL